MSQLSLQTARPQSRHMLFAYPQATPSAKVRLVVRRF